MRIVYATNCRVTYRIIPLPFFWPGKRTVIRFLGCHSEGQFLPHWGRLIKQAKFKVFLEAYPKYKDDEEKRLSDKEEKVKEFLSEIAKIVHVTKTLPEEASAFSSISTNLKHKERELDQNINTMENLSQGESHFGTSIFTLPRNA